MAKQAIGIGTTADDGTGDTLRAGGDKINDNFDELYDLMGDGTDLSSGISATASVVTLTAPAINGVVAGTQTSATITTISSASTITLDAETDITLDAKGGDIYLKDDGTIFGTLVNNGGNLVIKNSSAEVAAISIAGDEVVTLADDLVIKDGGTIGVTSAVDAMTLASTGIVTFKSDVYVADDKYVKFGDAQDILVGYDETTTDSLKIAATEGAGLAITLMADEGDDAGDEWKLNIADGGTLTLGNDINSAGTYVTHLTITPNSTVASSTMAFAGSITAAGNTLATASDATALAIALG